MRLTGVRRVLVGVGSALVLGVGLGPVVWQVAHPGPPGVALSGYDDPRLVRVSGEDELAYITRANAAVADNVEHRNTHHADQTWQVAFLDTITHGKFTGAYSLGEGIVTPRWLRRGFCSQHAIALAAVLRRNGVGSADAYQIDGHVVVQFEHDGQTWAVGPDLGVAPFVVDWSDPVQLRAAASVAYADTPEPYDAEWAVPIFVDTSSDAGAYPRHSVEAIAAMQDWALHAVTVGRWVVLGLAAAMMLDGLRRSGLTRSSRPILG